MTAPNNPRAARRTTRATRPTHRTRACLTLLVLGSLVLTPGAWAAPTVTLKAAALPIAGFPGTGNILGAGAEAEVQSTITGTEYGGFPSPLVLITIDSPVGTKVSSNGFPTCAPATLEIDGPEGCPKKSTAGPQGEGLGVVSFGDERVAEKASIQGFFAPDNALIFYVDGSTPVSLQIVEKARWVSGNALFGPQAIVEVPLIETVPDAPDVSILSFKVAVGAAYRKGKKTVSYITLAKRCPKGGSPIKVEMKFLSGETATAGYNVPCPKR
jgi:hypothetical protein